MKKIFFLLAMLCFAGIALQAQAPQGINYQGVARDNMGNAISKTAIAVKFHILQSSSSVYVETHTTTTDTFGLYSLVIGNGTPVSGTFNSIPWSAGNISVQVDINGSPIATTLFQSVPYALYSGSSSSGVTSVTSNNTNNINIVTSGTSSVTVDLATVTTNTGTFGGTTTIPQITVDQYGRVTSASNQTITTSGVTSVTGTGPITATTSGGVVTVSTNTVITAGNTITSSTAIPVIAYDQYGRITTVGSTPITGLLPGSGTNGQVLQVSSGVPTWVSPTVPTTTVSSSLPIKGDGSATNPLTISIVPGAGMSASSITGSTVTLNADLNSPLWNAKQIQSVPTSTLAPSLGDVLTYTAGNWAPMPAPGAFTGVITNPPLTGDGNVMALNLNLATNHIYVGDVGGNAQDKAMSGDASIVSTGSLTVTGLQGTPVSVTTPTTGQVLQYNGTKWAPATGGGVTTWTVNGSGTSVSPVSTYTTVAIGTNTPSSGSLLEVQGGPSGAATFVNNSSTNPTLNLQNSGTSFALGVNNNGGGTAGNFGANGNQPTIVAGMSSSGTSDVIQATNSSTAAIGGSAGNFKINSASNTSNAVNASTSGSGAAVYGTNSGTSGSAGYFTNTGATNGSNALYVSTTGTGTAVFGTNIGTSGSAGSFSINNASNNSSALGGAVNSGGGPAVSALNAGTGDGFSATVLGLTGRAGNFLVNNAAHNTQAVLVNTNGVGNGAVIHSTNTGTTVATAFVVTAAGTGAGSYSAQFSGGKGVQIDKLQVQTGLNIPLGANNGFVLTSDAAGNATWVAPSGGTVTSVTTSAPLTGTLSAGAINVGLSTSGVTAGPYGGVGIVPTFTVDTYGRITNASTNNISSSLLPVGANTQMLYNNAGTWTAAPTASLNFNGTSMGIGTTPATAMLDVKSTSASPAINATSTAAGPAISSNASGAGPAISSTSTGASAAVNATNSGTGAALSASITNSVSTTAVINTNNVSNSQPSLWITHSGTGKGLYVQNNGGGFGGYFYTASPNTNNALFAQNDGTGAALSVTQNSAANSGAAGFFNVLQNSNNAPAISATTSGLGSAGNFSATNASNSANVISATSSGTGAAIFAQAVTGAAISASNTGGSHTIYSQNNGTGGNAGNFQINNASSGNDVISATTTGTGNAIYASVPNNANAVYAITSGGGNAISANALTGPALYARNNGASPSLDISNGGGGDVIKAATSGAGNSVAAFNGGTGSAGLFNITSATNTVAAVSVNTAGTGYSGIYSGGQGLKTDGFSVAVRSTNVATTLTNNDYFLIITGGAGTITLPTPASCPGRIYIIKIIPAGGWSFAAGSTYTNNAGTGGQTTIPASTTFRLVSDGANWQAW